MAGRCGFFFKASISRLLFAVHGAIVCGYIFLLQYSYGLHSLNFGIYFAAPLCMLPIEMIITLCCTKHGEWKWFSPALMLYLLCVIPSIGFMHVDIHNRRMEKLGNPGEEKCVTNSSSFPSIDDDVGWLGLVKSPITLTEFPEVFEQTTMFLVILGRWMLPKGNLTREQLSQLLLVYLGMAADILEFSSESLAQNVVACDLIKIGIVTGIWGMSLCQFTLVLTSVAGPKIRNFRGKKGKRGRDSGNDEIDTNSVGVTEEGMEVKVPSICGSEIWSLLIVLFLQDCPFLAMRLYLIITIKVIDRAMLFFAGKNLLVFMLVTYRIIVLCKESNLQAKVKPMPLVGVPQPPGWQPQAKSHEMVVKEQKPSWSTRVLLPRATAFKNCLRDQVREITSGRGAGVPSESKGSTSNQTTPSFTIMECHSLKVIEVDDVDDSASPAATYKEPTDTAPSPTYISDDRSTSAAVPEQVDGPSNDTLNLHQDIQPVPLTVDEVENDHKDMASSRSDIIEDNLDTINLGPGGDMKACDVNDESINCL